jgi:hypothetical protein
MRRMRLACCLILVACSSAPKPPVTSAPSGELSTALAPLAWWLGDWQVESGATGTEHWVASSGVIFGIALQDNAALKLAGATDSTLAKRDKTRIT